MTSPPSSSSSPGQTPLSSSPLSSSPLSSSPLSAGPPALSPRSSDSTTATVRVSSPLNPNNSSPRLTPLTPVAFPSSSQSSPTGSNEDHPRGVSMSFLGRGRGVSPARVPVHSVSSPGPVTHSVSSPPATATAHSSPGTHAGTSTPTLTVSSPMHEGASRSRISLPDDLGSLSGDVLVSSFSRSRSTSRDVSPVRDRGLGSSVIRKTGTGTETPPNAPPRSWWGASHSPSLSKRRLTKEEEVLRVTVRKRVLKATLSTLGTLADLTHEALELGVEWMELAPVPGLSAAARTVLGIWDAVEGVEMNRIVSLRLTERCADILYSVRLEVHDAGDRVVEELEAPVARLEESFVQVYHFLLKNNRRPLLKRYLKRDEIQRELAGLDASLRDALGLFGLSVQIRILKQVQEGERARQRDMKDMLERLLAQREQQQPMEDTGNALRLTLDSPQQLDILEWGSPTSPSPLPTPAEGIAFPIPEIHAQVTPAEINAALARLHEVQNHADWERDEAWLREFLRGVVQCSDVEVVDAMGIGRGDMVEAVKTLQRALEKEREKDREREGEVVEETGEKGERGGLVRRLSLKDSYVVQKPAMERSKTLDSTLSASSGTRSGKGSKENIDREFMETSIDALRRMSSRAGMDTGDLPSWTITRYEVDRDLKVGMGFFSDVYKGTWRGKTVAIKVLGASAPRDLFKREAEIWKPLKHPNVLELFGASSTAGDPPWFFVSPYLRNGSLVDYLRRVEGELGAHLGVVGAGGGRGRQATLPVWNAAVGRSASRSPGRVRTISSGSGRGVPVAMESGEVQREWDLWRFMHEIAKGMQYLHSHGVYHGDLKATNILVDNNLRCVISDFGQSEIKNEAYRLSGKTKPHGTLRWQAPELMSGHANARLTAEMDIYAFAICCVEILTMGKMPWTLMDDAAVRYFVLQENTRPAVPASRFYTPVLQDLLRRCWDREPKNRPPFGIIVKELKAMRKSAGVNPEEVASPRLPDLHELAEEEVHPAHASPDMRPAPLPPVGDVFPGEGPTTPPVSRGSHSEDIVSSADPPGATEVVTYTSSNESSRSSTINSMPESPTTVVNHVLRRLQTPIAQDERMLMERNERRYRLYLEHSFHQSLTLPLWSPTPVELGAVGYLKKPEGEFVTLFNAFSPHTASDVGVRTLPSVYGYGLVKMGSQKVDRRTLAQKGADKIAGWLTFKSKNDGVTNQTVSRRYTLPLKAGHKVSLLYTELTDYRYVESLDAPKRWLKAHVDPVMQIFGMKHQIQKEDLFLVIGTLQTPHYALFVSHTHPDGHAHFNVYPSTKKGEPWGTFTTDTLADTGPAYADRADATRVSASKVSSNGGPWDSVLLARLRFKPDVLEPTSL